MLQRVESRCRELGLLSTVDKQRQEVWIFQASEHESKQSDIIASASKEAHPRHGETGPQELKSRSMFSSPFYV